MHARLAGSSRPIAAHTTRSAASSCGGATTGGVYLRSFAHPSAEAWARPGNYDDLTGFVSTDSYAQHNPEAADGLDGFGAAAATWNAQGKTLAYKRVHQTIADGDFVFTRSEGEFGVPVMYNDLWRMEDGKIVEHWDVITPIPAELPHSNGVF